MALYYEQDPRTGEGRFTLSPPTKAPIATSSAPIPESRALALVPLAQLLKRVPASAAPAPRPLAAATGPVPKRDLPDWLKVVLVLGGAALAGVALGKVIKALTSTPRSVGSTRLPWLLLPPPDPETVAIRRTAKRFVKDGAEVRADIAGWPRPPKINGHIPDVHAVYPDGREVVLEFENARSVFSTHARRQDAAFSAHADEFEHVEYEQVVVKNGRGGRG